MYVFIYKVCICISIYMCVCVYIYIYTSINFYGAHGVVLFRKKGDRKPKITKRIYTKDIYIYIYTYMHIYLRDKRKFDIVVFLDLLCIFSL